MSTTLRGTKKTYFLTKNAILAENGDFRDFGQKWAILRGGSKRGPPDPIDHFLAPKVGLISLSFSRVRTSLFGFLVLGPRFGNPAPKSSNFAIFRKFGHFWPFFEFLAFFVIFCDFSCPNIDFITSINPAMYDTMIYVYNLWMLHDVLMIAWTQEL